MRVDDLAAMGRDVGDEGSDAGKIVERASDLGSGYSFSTPDRAAGNSETAYSKN